MEPDEIYERFQKETADQVLTVEQDSEINRVLHWGKPGSSCYHVRVVTYPGGLAIVGDMGQYVIQRTRDMFKFFRGCFSEGSISWSYIAEKTVAGKVRKFSEEKADEYFRNLPGETAENYGVDLSELDPKLQERLENAVKDWQYAECRSEQDYYLAARNVDDEPPSCKEYEYHFVWCIYAIRRIIELYDARLPVVMPDEKRVIITNEPGSNPFAFRCQMFDAQFKRLLPDLGRVFILSNLQFDTISKEAIIELQPGNGTLEIMTDAERSLG